MSSILDNEEKVFDVMGNTTLDNEVKKVMISYPISEPGKDAYGHKLYVGDYVLYTASSNDIEGNVLRLGKIKKICPKLITVLTTKRRTNFYWSDPSYNGVGLPKKGIKEFEESFSVRTNRIIKIFNIEEFLKNM